MTRFPDDFDRPAASVPDLISADFAESLLLGDLLEDDSPDDESLADFPGSIWDIADPLDLELDDEPDPEPGDFWIEPDDAFD